MFNYFVIIISLTLFGLVAIGVFWRIAFSGTADLEKQLGKRHFFGIPVAEKITMSDLPDQLTRLANGQTEFDFLGIHSNGTDCIYLMYDDFLFNIDFEAMAGDQVPYIERLKRFADSRQIETSMLTYGNEPHFNSSKPAQVLRLEINANNIEKAVEIARDIQIEVFDNTNDTVYEVVP